LSPISPRSRLLRISMHDDRRFVLTMIKAGAKGYLLTDNTFQELAKAMRVVVTNKTCLSSELADIVVKDYLATSTSEESSVFSLLSPRESEVLQLIAEGKTTNQIGEYLHVSIKSAETHRAQLMAQLRGKGVAELTKYAVREGLTYA
jgi:two-component system, NarL family, response regulator NreC